MQQSNATNETLFEQYLWDFTGRVCNTPTAVLACISYVANFMIIATLLSERKTSKKLSSVSIQLLILAVTDVAFSMWCVSGFVYRVLIEQLFLPKNVTITVYHIFWACGWISASTNRVLTLYITFTRARIVWSLSQANQSLRKTDRDHIRETLLYGVFSGALLGIAQFIINKYFTDQYARGHQTGRDGIRNSARIDFLGVICPLVVMASLAFYILGKSHRLNLDATARVMQKNVAAVALLFCLCHLPMLIQVGEVAFQSEGKTITYLDGTTIPLEMNSFFCVVNNAADIFIYVAVGAKFRTTLFGILTNRPNVKRATLVSSSHGGRRSVRTFLK
jgi:hypothetical protein